MIPYQFLSKMGNYEVTVHGYKVEVSVVTDVRLIAGKISELMTFLETRRVMGLDFKFDRYNRDVEQVLLCAGNRCSVIPAINSDGCSLRYCKELRQLLSDSAICFVGISEYKLQRFNRHSLVCKVGVGFGHLAARVLKKPKLAWCCKVEELGLEVGLDIKPPAAQYVEPFQEPHWSGKVVFSEEEIMFAVHEVYATYLTGDKLLGMRDFLV